MPHHTPLIATIVAGLAAAFVLGAIAQRLRLSPLVGYLIAGIIVGPFTPGYVADQGLASQLAEIGVILLMFGVGLHFSLKDLMAARSVALPGAIAQMATATLMGMGLAFLFGWEPLQGFVFGLALSCASTVVLIRALQERRIVQTERGRIAIGWLIVEDLAMVLALVLLPALAQGAQGGGASGLGLALGGTALKVGAFVVFMLIVGRRVIPWVLHYVAHTGSRELFRLAVLSIALGVAFGAASLFGVSFALGAFFAGMILAESELSQRAAEETLPLRDAFAVLFFVSVGMLFDWRVVLREPLPLLATLGVVVVGKSVAALILMRVLRRSGETSFTVAASLAQIGEFSFILAGLGVELGLLPREGRDLILGGAIFSILLNPLAFGLAARLVSTKGRGAPAETVDLSGHTVVVGYGRVGQRVAEGLRRAKMDFVVVEAGEDAAALARERGLTVIEGNAADPRILAGANLPKAGRLVVAIPDAFEAGQVAEQARQANRGVQIIARAHSDAEVAHLLSHGAGAAIMGEREIADRMVETVTEQGGEARAEPPPLGRTPPGLILDDVERIVLSGFQVGEANAYQTLAADALEAHAEAHGVSRARAQAAIGGLEAKGCLAAVGDDHVSLTETGFLAVSTTRKPL